MADFSPEIEFEDLYHRHYQPAKHPGDEHRQTRTSYLGELKKLNDYFWFCQWLERFAAPPREFSIKQLTADFYWWQQHCEQLPRGVRLCDVTDSLVTGAMNWRIELGWQRTTANKLRRTVNAVWEWAAEQLDLRGPRNKKYREDLNEPIAFMPDELERIFAACKRHPGCKRTPGCVGDVPAAVWWTMCVAFIHAGGLRIGAALKVPTSKLDLVRGAMRVPSGAQKNRREKWLDFFPGTTAALRAVKLTERGVKFVLGDFPYNADTLRRHFSQILVEAELFPSIEAVPRELKFHALRKTLASQMYAKTGALSIACDRLDHSSTEVTKRYIDPRYESEQRIVDLVSDPLAPPPTSPGDRPLLRIADCG